ncbi:MAG: selenocysteine-specific translation elongation factor [Chloroflexota bacterium]
MRVIGTAGHVDHGKSTLVQALTGIDPDRWREEKVRGLTIDLGFAWFELPDGETVGVVDVPGHRDFIENMLAGVGGLDAVLFVIAADEGIMPQTREHLAIIDLLGIPNGIIVITKVDLIDDEEWLDLIELDIHSIVENTVLADADILRVSAKTGDGIETLISTLSALFQHLPPHTDYNQPRLPIDRVFTVDGFGTVVTGTLSGGTLRVGDIIEIQPTALQGRVRGLQSYQHDVKVARPSSRVAVNIAGISTDDIKRGDVLAFPEQLNTTQLIDVSFRYLADVDHPLKHNTEVKFFSGASETMATVRLLGQEILPAGETGWLQLRLRDALPLTQRERFILRLPSPAQTIGGGVIVNAHPAQRWKRFDDTVLEQLETMLEGTPSERVAQVADADAPLKYVHLQRATTYADDILDDAIREAINNNRLVVLPDETFWAAARYQAMQQQIMSIVGNYHKQYPLRLGISREELRKRLNIKHALLNILLDNISNIIIRDSLVCLATHHITFNETQQAKIEKLASAMNANPTTPPSYKEAIAIVGEDILHALIDLEDLIQVSDDVIFNAEIYQKMVESIIHLIENQTSVDAKQVRDHLETSRKYAIALLEHLDQIGITRRIDDVRVLGHAIK